MYYCLLTLPIQYPSKPPDMLTRIRSFIRLIYQTQFTLEDHRGLDYITRTYFKIR